MKHRIVVLGSVLFLLFAAASSVHAAGFRLPEQGAAAMGMAGAFIGQADDATAVWHNPAGITQLEGTQISGGATEIIPILTHENTAGVTEVSDRTVHTTAHFFATHRISDNAAFGLGITSPFGLSTDWGDRGSMRYTATFSKIVTTNINPNIAFKLSDRLSAAVGADFIKFRATMEKMLFLGPILGDRNFRLSGDGDGWGANAGLLYKASDKISAGLSYRSRIKVKVDGTVSVDAPLPNLSNNGSTEITLPDLFQAGVSVKATDRLTLNGDIEYTMWSTYDRLVITSNTFLPLTGSQTSTDEKQWKDVFGLRLGGQYMLNKQWKLRAGYVYDKNPVPEAHIEPRVPDADRQGITVGTGYSAERITIDAAYMYLKFFDRTINNSQADDATPNPNALNGTFKSQAHLVGLTVAYKF